jgi:hypothetical protein
LSGKSVNGVRSAEKGENRLNRERIRAYAGGATLFPLIIVVGIDPDLLDLN